MGGQQRSQQRNEWISLTVPAGSNRTSAFVVQGVDTAEGLQSPLGTCVLLATPSAENYVNYTSGPAWLSIVQPALAFSSLVPPDVSYPEGLPETVSFSSANVKLYVNTGVPKPDGSNLASKQAIRTGGTPLPVTVSLSFPSGTPTPAATPAALVYVPPTPAQSVLVTVPAGSFYEELQLDLLDNPGTVTVSATTSAEGWVATDAATGDINVANIPTPTRGCDLEF